MLIAPIIGRSPRPVRVVYKGIDRRPITAQYLQNALNLLLTAFEQHQWPTPPEVPDAPVAATLFLHEKMVATVRVLDGPGCKARVSGPRAERFTAMIETGHLWRPYGDRRRWRVVHDLEEG